MSAARSDRRVAVAAGLALTAAFLWATYYSFVLGAPNAAPAALLVDPFLVGGVAFLGLAALERSTSTVPRLFRDPRAFLRAGLLLGMQVGVLASTYLTGPVDTSLLSLLGDVVLTPIALLVLYREGGERFRSPGFLGGLALATAGSAVVIGGGAAVEPLRGWAWAVAPGVPVLVALYFLYTARASRSTPMPALVGQCTVLAGLLGIAVSPWLPGGAAGLVPTNAQEAGIVVGIGVTSFFLGPYLYFRAIATAGIVLPAVLMTAIPVFTLALGVLFGHEVPPLVALAGIPIAILGSFLALRGPHAAWASTPTADSAAK